MPFAKNKLSKTLIAILILGSVFLPIFESVVHAQTNPVSTAAQAGLTTLSLITPALNTSSCGLIDVPCRAAQTLVTLTNGLLTLCSWALAATGALLEFILKFTLVDMSIRLSSSASEASMGAAISDAWGTMRDIANLAFIFVLLYAAIKVILDMNAASIGSTIKNIIIVGLLINFSMFFTKVAVDVSNIATIGFYNAIQAGIAGKDTKIGDYTVKPGLSSAVMNAVKLQNLYGDRILETKAVQGDKTNVYMKLSLTNIIGSIIEIVLAVIFLVVSVMFLARFILVVLLIVTSAAAAIAWMVPGLKTYWNQWLGTLQGQLAFPPAFMLMMWISFKMMYSIRSVTGSGASNQFATIGTEPLSALGLIMNYALVLGFMVASLVIAKSIASKSTGFGAITGVAGGAIVGGAAFAGRQTLGRTSRWVSENKREAWSKSATGRAGLWIANKGKSSSFDTRALGDTVVGKATGMGTLVGGIGKAGGKKGFQSTADEKAKKKAEYAKNVYSQTSAEKAKAEELKRMYEDGYKDERTGEWVQGSKKNYEKAVEKEEKEVKDNSKKTKEELDAVTKNLAEKEKELKQQEADRIAGIGDKAKEDTARKATEDARAKLTAITETHNQAISRQREVLENKNYSKATEALGMIAEKDKGAWEDIKDAGKNRQIEYAKRFEKKTAMPTGATVGAAVGTLAGPLGTIVGAAVGGVAGRFVKNLAGNKEAARKVREIAEGKDGKSKKEVRKMLAEAGVIEKGKEDEEGDEERKEEKTKEKEGGEKKEEKKT